MATRAPLVLVSGQIQQLQAGDSINVPQSGGDVAVLTNDDVGAHAVGDIVYADTNDGVKKAKADAVGTTGAIAIAAAAISASASGSYMVAGVLAGLSGLVAGTEYYLSAATAGLITATAPSTPGQYVVKVGRALSTTELMVDIERPILL
jgi:hypothetical protein